MSVSGVLWHQSFGAMRDVPSTETNQNGGHLCHLASEAADILPRTIFSGDPLSLIAP